MPSAIPESKISELYQMDAENKRRLRDIEQRLAAIDNSVKRQDSGLLDLKSKVLELSGSLKSDRSNSESKIKEIQSIINEMIGNMKRLAEKSELIAVKELLDIYNPVKSKFVTREEVENMLKERRR